MNIKTTIPLSIWDAKKFHWKLFLQGKFESLSGCPNWLYEEIRQIKSSGQAQEDTIHVMEGGKYQYAVRFAEDAVQIYSKRK
jgi:hypothetical protein